MILADSFCQNEKARSSEFSTTTNDTPLIVQFAANNRDDFIDASKLVFPYADGIDLNCGCPQRWAMKDGYGCALLSKPEIIHDLVKGIRNNLPHDFSVSVKIRILKEIKKTVDLCQQLEKCGVTFLTIHGRTPSQKSGDKIDTEALKTAIDSVSIPVIANGGIKSLNDADQLYQDVNCSGVMAASSMLSNPGLFSGANRTPFSCVRKWMDLKNEAKERITFQCYHHHLVFMLDKLLTKQQKNDFNTLCTFDSVDEYVQKYVLGDYVNDVAFVHDLGEFVTCDFPQEITLKHASKCRRCSKSIGYCICCKYDSNATDGSFFTSYLRENDSSDYMDSNLFNED